MPEDHRDTAPPTAPVRFYDATYARFHESLYREIRRETWGQDIGQNGWITAEEQDRLIEHLALAPGQRLLDVACGSGGPTLRIAQCTGAHAVGVDRHADAINAATQEAAARNLLHLAAFHAADAQQPLPFPDESFDAITCIDAINHLADRPRVLADWARLLKPGGRLLFTDPAVVTGPLSNDEIATRASIGFFLFVAPDTNDRLLAEAGLQPIAREDLTEALARTAAAWHAARHKRAAALTEIEGRTTFDGQQRFLETAARLARERRLSRFMHAARKPA